MLSRFLSIILGLMILFGCDMVKNVQQSSNAIVENRHAVEAATAGIRENKVVVNESSDAIEENVAVVESSTRVIRENAEAVEHSTKVIRANAAVVESATAMMPKVDDHEIAVLLLIAVLFFLFGLPLITAYHLSRISRKMTRLEKELKKNR